MHSLDEIYSSIQANGAVINQASIASGAGQDQIATQVNAITALISTLDATAQLILANQIVANAALDQALQNQTGLQSSIASLKDDPRTPIRADDLPLVIDQPGSYYLAENAVGISGANGIVIAVSNVTLDLNGFSVFGVQGSIDGIAITASSKVEITNGLVEGWGGNGISGVPPFSHLENLRISQNENAGVIGSCTATTILGCTSILNGTGFDLMGDGIVLQHSFANENSSSGFKVGDNSVFTSCVAIGNGFHGFDLRRGSTLFQCFAGDNGSQENVGRGFSGEKNLTFSGCVAKGNAGHGFHSPDSAGYIECAAYQNGGGGFDCRASIMVSCTSNDNLDDGFELSGIIKNCAASGNAINYDAKPPTISVHNWEP